MEETSNYQNKPANLGIIGRWWRFLQERHEPVGISLMVLAFFSANAVIAINNELMPFISWKRMILGYCLIWLVFLHMRLFDEVKDYQFDLKHNPERPLARGLIDLLEFGVGTLLCLSLEIVIAAILGIGTAMSYSILLAFTLLMRMEFFVSEWLRPKLELYAISHTFSAFLLGLTIFSAVTGKLPNEGDKAVYLFAFGNWFVFNVFEFGRKTFGPEEEKTLEDSYSYRLKPWGAMLLLLVNLIIGYILLGISLQYRPQSGFQYIMPSAGGICLLVLVAGIIYSIRPTIRFAKLYRGAVTFYLFAYHLAIAVGGYLAFFRQ